MNRRKKPIWKDEWYKVLRDVALSVISNSRYQKNISVDELINHAWIDSVRRLEIDVKTPLLKHAARQSMKRYLGHKYGDQRHRPIHYCLSSYDKSGEMYSWEKKRAWLGPRITYDDADELKSMLLKLSQRDRNLILFILKGYKRSNVGIYFRLTEGRISQILKKLYYLGRIENEKIEKIKEAK